MKKLGFGMMRLPLTNPEDQKSIDIEQTCKMVDTFLEKGFTYFDTAYMYHDFTSENTVKKVLVERHPRESFLLASKLPVMFLKKKSDMERIFNEQLEKCGVEYFDYYLLHSLQDKSFKTAEKLKAFDFVMQKKAEGKIKKIGFSFHDSADVLDKILKAHPEMEFVQLQINYLDWESNNVQSRKCYETALKYGKEIIVMEPVKGGTLAAVPKKSEQAMKEIHPDLSVASWAIRFCASLENVICVLSGMSNMAQLNDNLGYMESFVPFTQKEKEIVMQTADMINATASIPCTACRYCVSECPKNIPIPDYFELYNAQKQEIEKPFTVEEVHYEALADRYSKASDCIECKKCSKICPQHLNVPKYLKRVAELFE